MRLKENNLYIVADAQGQISGGDNGLYRRDTRFLSVLEWRIGGEIPTVLSTHSSEPYRFSQHATEADLGHTARLELRRKGILDGSNYVENVRLRAFATLEAHREWGRDLPDLHTLELRLESDFADMFEVRGLPLKAKVIQLEVVDDGLIWIYAGSDGIKRALRVHLEPMGQEEAADVGQQLPPSPLARVLDDFSAGGRIDGPVVRARAKAEPAQDTALFACELGIMSCHGDG